MADILIRGMEMPENCLECILTHAFFRNLRCDKLEGMSGFVGPLPHTNDRHPDCPIGPMPEGHGRLVDADALDKFLDEKEKEADDEEFYIGEAWYKTFRQILRATQFIVPAEGSSGQ